MKIFFDSSLREGRGGFLHEDAGNEIPGNAIEITREEFDAAFAGQSSGKEIWAGSDGKPELRDAPGPDAKQKEANFRATRSNLLSASDWTQGGDSPLAEITKNAWARYRKALRDYPASVTDWSNPPDFPAAPK